MSPTRVVPPWRRSRCAVSLRLAAPSSARPAQGPAPEGIEPATSIERPSRAPTSMRSQTAPGVPRTPFPPGTTLEPALAASRGEPGALKALLAELAANADRPRGSDRAAARRSLRVLHGRARDRRAMGVAPLVSAACRHHRRPRVAGVQRMIRGCTSWPSRRPFVLSGASDYHDPASVIVNIAAGGLGLPDRDVLPGLGAALRGGARDYRAHVAACWRSAECPACRRARRPRTSLRSRRRLAEASLAPCGRCRPAATGPQGDVRAARGRGASTGSGTSREAGLPRTDVNVAEPAFLERLDRELASTPVEVWKAYLTWHLLESASPWLARPFAEESFAFKDSYLGGAREMKPAPTRCLESTEAAARGASRPRVRPALLPGRGQDQGAGDGRAACAPSCKRRLAG
jgi:predicted metalloendopeptidase